MHSRCLFLTTTIFASSCSALSAQSSLSKAIRGDVDRGKDYGNVVIVNNCDQDMHLQSVGSWEKMGNANKLVNGVDPEGVVHTIPAHGEYREPYRELCPNAAAAVPGTNVCLSLQKMRGNGASLKISVSKGPNGVTQLEYALVQEPEDNFPRLNFDVSLLDCAQPEQAGVTDLQASTDQGLVTKKIAGCPGYEKGLAVWFDDHAICRPIYCDSANYCDAIYNYDRTRRGEMSLRCSKEYHGNFHFELCVENGGR
jgi:hypothetical protein